MVGTLFTFATIPNVSTVSFLDQARTRASVGIRTWSSGGSVLMEKTAEGWRVTGVTSAYVE
jgi:hypothetical protein